jgi:hypothetical protein
MYGAALFPTIDPYSWFSMMIHQTWRLVVAVALGWIVRRTVVGGPPDGGATGGGALAGTSGDGAAAATGDGPCLPVPPVPSAPDTAPIGAADLPAGCRSRAALTRTRPIADPTAISEMTAIKRARRSRHRIA